MDTLSVKVVLLMVELGEKLKELRLERKWTQGYVANRIGVTASIISAYETGIRQPSYEVLIRLVHLYQVSSDYLLGISGKRTPDSQYLVSLDGLTPAKITLVMQLISALKE